MIVLKGDATPNSVIELSFGLTDRALGLLRGLFSTDPSIKRAIVYGSRAKGNFRHGSDIDITLDAPDMDGDGLLRLCTAVDELMLPWHVDLSLLTHIDNPDLLDHIARVGKTLWVRRHGGTDG